MARELIASDQIMYHVWFLEYQRVLPQLRLHLPRHHLHHRSQHRLTEIQYRRTEVWKLEYQKEVGVRMKSFGETRGNRKKYKEICRMNCLIGFRNWGRIWLMKVLQKSFGEAWCRGVQTLPVRLMNLVWSREQKWNRVRVSTVSLLPKDRNCEICLRIKITRASCTRCANAIVPRAEKFGDLITADHKVLSEDCEYRNNHPVAVQDLAAQWLQSYPCKTKSSQETEKSSPKFLEPTAKPKVT